MSQKVKDETSKKKRNIKDEKKKIEYLRELETREMHMYKWI